jgi:hypothetical protein
LPFFDRYGEHIGTQTFWCGPEEWRYATIWFQMILDLNLFLAEKWPLKWFFILYFLGDMEIADRLWWLVISGKIWFNWWNFALIS